MTFNSEEVCTESVTCPSHVLLWAGGGIKVHVINNTSKPPKCGETNWVNSCGDNDSSCRHRTSVPADRRHEDSLGRLLRVRCPLLSSIPSPPTPRSVLPSLRDGHYRGNSTHGEHGGERWVAGWRLPKVNSFHSSSSPLNLLIVYFFSSVIILFLNATARDNWRRLRCSTCRKAARKSPTPRQIQQGAGVVLSLNGLRPRHVTQQQLPSINTASPGKWWQDLLRDRHAGRSSKKGVVTAVDARRHSALDRMLSAGAPRNERTQPIKSKCA